MVYLPSISTALALATLLASVQAAGKTCKIKSGSADDAKAITSAFKSCKKGGTVVFQKGHTYNVNSIVTVSGLKNVNVDFLGTVNLPHLDTSLQGANGYFNIEGQNIHWDGAGVGKFNGSGQEWWDALNRNSPTVLSMMTNHSVFRDFSIINSPRYFMNVTHSNDVVLEKLILSSVSTNVNQPKNTDGLDIYLTQNIVFRDSVITNGDDCTSFKGDVTNATLSNLTCTGSHGFSVGSLGKGGIYEYVKDITVKDSICTDCQNGIRIKTWNGGKGVVSGIRFENVELVNAENPILITTHYCDDQQMQFCNTTGDTSLSISDVYINNVVGSISSAKNSSVINVDCSAGTHCSNFTITNVNITRNANTPKNVCTYLDGSADIPYCSE